MGLLDFQRYRSSAGTKDPRLAASQSDPRVAQPQYGQTQQRMAAFNVPTVGAEQAPFVPEDPYADPHMTGLGFRSPVSQITGHNPSLTRAAETGDYKEPEWWLKGGPSIGATFASGTLEKTADIFGLPNPSKVISRWF